MPLPNITHLQFLVLGILMDGELPGRAVREKLRAEGVRKTLAAFYQLMARMEEGRLVEGWYEPKVVSGQTVKERRYKVKGQGIKAFEQALGFYRDHAATRLQGGHAHA